ncbi:MAG: NAD(P)/FAD-dependent oxidoreductase [Clostridium sp.]|uniref:NAD(P)/FAD-dependent oxidoreductase n=1 Tax=Butyribacter sp. TaxID=2822465 RepID=UPI002A9A7FC8|nr:NAD(P)/FAD-dependent oxidoreductase [Clostridium sp.]MDY5180037.1 NAD(P)/FAD-dependent oxidoreductase [Butyribacter sp.]
MNKVIVVGGGAAGMMAAISAADSGAEVILIEKNEKLGKKVYITGKGRCNITNESDVENLLKNVRSNPKFLYSAFYTFDSYRMMDFLEGEGLKLKTERGNRVFPESDKSSDVIKTLKKALEKRKVKIVLNTKVLNIEIKDGICHGVIVQSGDKSGSYTADKVIVATGGCSYQSTGSTGDGYRFAKDADIKVTKCYPSLVPFNIGSDIPKRLQGLSLRNVKVTLSDKGKVLYEELGEMLFTHFGVSGPLVLSASTLASGKDVSQMELSIDLKPALSKEQLDERILRDFSENRNSYFKNSLSRLLPAKMIPVIVELSEIDEKKQVNNITKEERNRLVNLLKGLTFKVESLRGFNEAIITKGGVSVKEINPGTMEAKKVKGLFFAGEVLDLDAVTGGYNLQIAWSTGYLAGMEI